MWCKYVLFLCFLNKDAFSQDSDNNKIIVETSTGLVRGNLNKTVDLQQIYYTYLGIPYAEPPIGNLRFEPPVPKSRWSGILDGTNYRSECVQSSAPVQGNEDCLFVNVFTPVSPNITDKKLPVIVWIHGGAFIGGSGNLTNTGPDFFLDQNVVFVSIQYRLGIFGFLSTGDLVVPGNTGLKDQILALKWINENIERFGGDAKTITIFGQSAGAASIAYLLQSKLTEGLYQRAIMDSGVSLCLWSLSRGSPQIAKTIGKDLNVTFDDSRSLVDGLKTVDYAKLQTTSSAAVAFKYLTTNPLNGFLMAPVVEPEHAGAVLMQKNYELLKTGQFNQMPILLGHNTLEGTFDIEGAMRLYLIKYDFLPKQLVPIDMNVVNLTQATNVGLKIKRKYFGLAPIALSNLNIMKYISDDMFVRPVQEFVKLWSKYVPAYYYVFSYEGALMGMKNRTTPGTAHTEELGYLFNTIYEGSEQDYAVRHKMVRLWSNFAKFGSPTPENDDYFNPKVTWPVVGNKPCNLTYLELGADFVVKFNPQRESIKFWTHLYMSNGNPPYDTY